MGLRVEGGRVTDGLLRALELRGRLGGVDVRELIPISLAVARFAMARWLSLLQRPCEWAVALG